MKVEVLNNDLPGDAPLDPTTLSIVSAPSHAHSHSIVSGQNAIRYTAAHDWEGTDQLTYRICDTSGRCDTATLTINIEDG